MRDSTLVALLNKDMRVAMFMGRKAMAIPQKNMFARIWHVLAKKPIFLDAPSE